MIDPRRIIGALRDGRGLSGDDAMSIANGLADGSVSDAQAAAFAMAALIRGTGDQGRVALTTAMRDSGHVMRWDLPGPIVDKHSTGGIGDTVSLILAPILAACGMFVPMISGRGLGHTGGTLDKLEAIPGFRCELDEREFQSVVRKVGCAIVSSSADLAPADRRLYAIRDESGTVQSIDLITASILSKKLAAGVDTLVLDVKLGSGAFLRTMDDARALATALVETAAGAGCKASALITDMDQPLATAAGNAVEVVEAIAVLKGEGGALRDLSLALSEECLTLAGADPAAAETALNSGDAADRFARMVAAQGGPANILEEAAHLPVAPVVRAVEAEGAVASIDTAALGHAVVALGGGRVQARDAIDHSVGLSRLAKLGDEVRAGRPLAIIHARSEADADAAEAAVLAAYHLGAGATPGPLVLDRIAA